ncbi:hypothetical protein QCA50_009655 [Cerrena zonata]|uniref:Sister chromatid cohesion protein DCC1 n=1 Tax=Cerrena zonata TaxID=2478898 RepID=A0AAW0G6P9_9APHY
MNECNLHFSSSPAQDTGSYRLLELPPELAKVLESSGDEATQSWSIKGESIEDAVLCTADKTYTVRSVILSNAVLVVTPSQSGDAAPDAVIRDQLHEIYELIPSVPRLQKLGSLLRGNEYNEGQEDEDVDMSDNDRPTKRQRLTYHNAREVLQASDAELLQGLQTRRILIIKDELRPIAPAYLTQILELLLTYLVSLSLSHQAAPVQTLTSSLEEEHEIKREVCTQVMEWFGQIEDGIWRLDELAAVKEVGLGVLRAYKDDTITEAEFLKKWESAVGDTFESSVSLDLLSGNYLTTQNLLTDPPTIELNYFPSSALPTDPAARFGDLFLTRQRWKAEEISPFLQDIVVNNKERDKLLLKYARTVTNKDGIWYTARAMYNG